MIARRDGLGDLQRGEFVRTPQLLYVFRYCNNDALLRGIGRIAKAADG